MARDRSRAGFARIRLRHAAPAAGAADARHHHRIRAAALETATHDVAGDSQGRIWYSPHRSSYIGRLDPQDRRRQGIPCSADGAKASLPGTHWITVDKDGMVWGSENWAHNIYRLNPETEEFTRVSWKVHGADQRSDGRQLRARSQRLHLADAQQEGQQGRRPHRRAGASYPDQEVPEHLWQRPEPRRPLFRRRRMAARRRRRVRLARRRAVRARARARVRGRHAARSISRGIIGRPDAAACWSSSTSRRKRVYEYESPTPYASFYSAHRGQERRGVGRRDARRPLFALQSEDRRVDAIRVAGALRHRPQELGRQLHQSRHASGTSIRKATSCASSRWNNGEA